jgi:hypothetical protein
MTFWHTNLNFSLWSNKQLLVGKVLSSIAHGAHSIRALATIDSDPLALICSQELHISADLNIRVPKN